MKTICSILDPSFPYVPAVATSVADTWRRFGWRPTTEEERSSRQMPHAVRAGDQIAVVRPAELAAPRACPPVQVLSECRRRAGR
jgi:hypothetical protein